MGKIIKIIRPIFCYNEGDCIEKIKKVLLMKKVNGRLIIVKIIIKNVDKSIYLNLLKNIHFEWNIQRLMINPFNIILCRGFIY